MNGGEAVGSSPLHASGMGTVIRLYLGFQYSEPVEWRDQHLGNRALTHVFLNKAQAIEI